VIVSTMEGAAKGVDAGIDLASQLQDK